jgi:hypothetical protein
MHRIIVVYLTWIAALAALALGIARHSTQEPVVKAGERFASGQAESGRLPVQEGRPRWGEGVARIPAAPAWEEQEEQRDDLYPRLASEPMVQEPRSGTTYDWTTDNSYAWRRNGDGSTDVDGLNARTGSIWHTRIEKGGSMRGTDSQFNPWTYDAGTKTYMNLGTGRVCTGEGYGRVCAP